MTGIGIPNAQSNIPRMTNSFFCNYPVILEERCNAMMYPPTYLVAECNFL
jgi:hypothetical protein